MAVTSVVRFFVCDTVSARTLLLLERALHGSPFRDLETVEMAMDEMDLEPTGAAIAIAMIAIAEETSRFHLHCLAPVL